MPKSSGAKIGGPMTMLTIGRRQPPGLRRMPRTWKPKPMRLSASTAAETTGSHVRAARRLRKAQMPAMSSAGLRMTGVYITRWP